MRHITPLVCIAIFACNLLFAEGTHELAPNGTITIGANTTKDIAALHINHPNYNSFASYSNPDPQSRLYIHVLDPQSECVFVGFSYSHANENVPDPVPRRFEFRIKDPNGNVVFGPMVMDPVNVNIHNWAEGYNGPMQVTGAGGYNGIQITSADLGSQGWSGVGDYYIEFRNDADNDMLIDFWDITVADCSGPTPSEKKGRVWSYNWSIFAINDYGFPNRPFNGAFYVCAPDPDNVHASFVTRIDFNGSGFRPAAFNIAFNSFGSMNTGNVAEDRKSVRNLNATQPEYSIFLNDPIEICETAEIGSIDLLGVSRCDANSYCIKFSTSKAGQVDLLLDFDGADNVYTPGTSDLMISQTVNGDQVNVPTCIEWDGLDGLGNLISENPGTQIPVTIAFAQGIYHFPIFDAELMTTGVKVQAIRPSAPDPLLYYDDSNVGVPSGSGEPVTQLSGCNTPCHAWTNYTAPNTIGFGNLCTINTWWFSQLIIRDDVFFLPAYFACGIEGPSHFCQGGSSQLTLSPNVVPQGSVPPEILDIRWTGPGIIGATDEVTIQLDQAGSYAVDFRWITGLGDTCAASCAYEVTTDPPASSSIDTLILNGDVVVINGESYSEGGVYFQTLTTPLGCDSILIIRVRLLNTVVHYDLNDCLSNTGDASAMDYSEFIPAYLQPLSCANITGGTLHRTPPAMNKHSCTPGVNGSVAMCVSSLDGCTYVAGDQASVVFELNVNPAPDTAVQVTGLSFFSQAPTTFNWINGGSGPNNYPTRYGLRVLKNGTEIFRVEDVPTTQNWSFESYDWREDENFIVEEPTTFTFEVLPYCLIGGLGSVAAYDMDEVSIIASCISPHVLDPFVGGVVKTVQAHTLPNVEIRKGGDPTVQTFATEVTDENGAFVFNPVLRHTDHYFKAYKNDDPLNGVSTIDLVRIQKHLLGLTPFTTAYEYIAADANHSNSVTVMDLIELRKLILGLYQTLPRNTSWRFGNARQELDIATFWSLQEVIGIEYLDNNDVTDIDFTAIKIGDLNGDAKTDLMGSQIQSRGQETIDLTFENAWAEAGQPVTVDLKVNVNELAGFQLAISGKGINITDIRSGLKDFNESNFSISEQGARVSWNTMGSLTAEANNVLVSVSFIPSTSGWVSELIQLDNGALNGEAYAGDDVQKFSFVLKNDLADLPANDFTFNVVPNPVKDQANLYFQLPEDGKVHFRMYDLSGQLLNSKEIDGVAGENSIALQANDFKNHFGLVICQLQTEKGNAVKRIVRNSN